VERKREEGKTAKREREEITDMHGACST